MWSVMTTNHSGRLPVPEPPEFSVRYRELVQIRAKPEQKAEWRRAARVRRQSLSVFTRACADAGAATRLHQSDLIKHLRNLRRLMNAATAGIKGNDAKASQNAVDEALKLIRKMQGGS